MIRVILLLAFVIVLFFVRDGAAIASSTLFGWGAMLLAVAAVLPSSRSTPSSLSWPSSIQAVSLDALRWSREHKLAWLTYAAYGVALIVSWRLHADAPSTMEVVRQLAFFAIVAGTARVAARTGPGLWIAVILVCLSLIVAQILGPSSIADHLGRDQNYSAIEQWSGYPEIGLLAALGASAAAALCLSGPGIALRIAGALLATGFTVGLFFLYSRFSIITAAAVIAWLALVCLTRWRRAIGIAIIVPLLLGGAWIVVGPGDAAAGAREAVASRLGSREMGIRAEGWRVARAMLAEKPWFGVGPGRYPFEYPRFTNQRDSTHAYNIVLHNGAELGWIGLMLYLAMWTRVAWISLAAAFVRVTTRVALAERSAALATHAMIVAFFVRSQSEHFLANLTTSYRLLLLVALLFGLAEGVRARRARVSDGAAVSVSGR